jgi:hypothetical protein
MFIDSACSGDLYVHVSILYRSGVVVTSMQSGVAITRNPRVHSIPAYLYIAVATGVPVRGTPVWMLSRGDYACRVGASSKRDGSGYIKAALF